MTRDDVRVGDDLGHVVGAGLRIVRAVERVVVDRRVRDLDLVAAGGAAGVLHGEPDAVDDRLRGRLLAALLRELDGELHGALARVPVVPPLGSVVAATAVASGEDEHRDGGERAELGVSSCTSPPRSSSPVALDGRPGRNLLRDAPLAGIGSPRRPSAARCVRPMGPLAWAVAGIAVGRRCGADDGADDRTSDGAQVAAEAMPYHSHRRTECNTGRRATRGGCRAVCRSPPRGATRDHPVGSRLERTQRSCAILTRCTRPRGIPGPSGPHHGHRTARRAAPATSSSGRAGRARSVAADLLRQLVYLPAGEHPRRREHGATIVGGGGPRAPAVGPRPAASSAPSTSLVVDPGTTRTP